MSRYPPHGVTLHQPPMADENELAPHRSLPDDIFMIFQPIYNVSRSAELLHSTFSDSPGTLGGHVVGSCRIWMS